MPEAPSVYDLINAGIGIAGLGLGILSVWRDHRSNKVKLRVIPKVYLCQGSRVWMAEWPTTKEGAFATDAPSFEDYNALCITVTNLSKFPVKISEIGFTARCQNIDRLRFTPDFTTPRDVDFPHRLEPRESLTCFAPQHLGPDVLSAIGKAYAMTDCDQVFKGTSRALKAFLAKPVA